MIKEIIQMSCKEICVDDFSLSTIADGFAMLQKDFFNVDCVIGQSNVFNNINKNFNKKCSPFVNIDDVKLIEQGIIALLWGAYVATHNVENVVFVSGTSCDTDERKTVKLILNNGVLNYEVL